MGETNYLKRFKGAANVEHMAPLFTVAAPPRQPHRDNISKTRVHKRYCSERSASGSPRQNIYMMGSLCLHAPFFAQKFWLETAKAALRRLLAPSIPGS